MANFKRNDEAVKSDTFSSGPIKKTGIYCGHFTKAYIRKSKVPGAKSEAIHFDFTSSTGNYGNFDIWYQDKEGNKIDRGITQIHGLMALLNIDELKEKKNHIIEIYDWDMKVTTQVCVDSYPELLDTHIGTVWQIEEYIKKTLHPNGIWMDTNPIIIKDRAVFLQFCDAKTHASPAEFLNGIDPVVVDSFVHGLPDIKRINEIKQPVNDKPSTNDNEDDVPW